MEKSHLFDAVVRHRLALCDQLDELSSDQWNADSLCAGWRVRDVLAHLVTLQVVPTRKFVLGAFSLSGFHRRTDRFAREWGQRDPGELVARYRQHATGTVAPPFVGPIAPLTDIIVHAHDIERPLGLPTIHEERSMELVLTALCGGLPGFTSRRLVRGLRFDATDRDWTHGDGPVVAGSTSDLLLAVTGRPIASNVLSGDGAATLIDRLR